MRASDLPRFGVHRRRNQAPPTPSISDSASSAGQDTSDAEPDLPADQTSPPASSESDESFISFGSVVFDRTEPSESPPSSQTSPASTPPAQRTKGKERAEHLAIFDLFATLPVELRLRVWELSLTPLLLPFVLAGPTQQSPLDARSCRRYPWRHISSPLRKCPTLLHVNREARSVALKWYTESRMRARVEWFELGEAEDGSMVIDEPDDGLEVTQGDEEPVAADVQGVEAAVIVAPPPTETSSPSQGANVVASPPPATITPAPQPTLAQASVSPLPITARNPHPRHLPCLMEAVVARRNKHCYWRPSTDIVWLSSASLPSTLPPRKHANLPDHLANTIASPFACTDLCAISDRRERPVSRGQTFVYSTANGYTATHPHVPTAIAAAQAEGGRIRTCNTESAHCEFLFDRRVKYLAMDKQMWNIWIRSAMTVCSGLEVVWVVVDHETRLRNARVEKEIERRARGEGGPSEASTTVDNPGGSTSASAGSTANTPRSTISKKKKGFDDTHISSKSSTWERVEVRLVESVEEIFDEINNGWS